MSTGGLVMSSRLLGLSRLPLIPALMVALIPALMVAVAGCGEGATSMSAPSAWDLKPFVTPTLPAQIPPIGSVDPATGLHVNATPQVVDLATYRLAVTGRVTRPLSLSYDDLRGFPKVTASPDLLCPGNFIDKTTWSGVPLKTILEMAGIGAGAKKVRMNAADGYTASLDLDDALQPENFLAYEWMSQPLPVLHGFPLRAVMPGLTGYIWVKWLVEIVVE